MLGSQFSDVWIVASAIIDGMHEEIQRQLDVLAQDSRYRVVSTLKETPSEITQLVYRRVDGGAEQGPFIRKCFDCESGLGQAYTRIYEEQQKGTHFAHIPEVYCCYDIGETRVVVLQYVEGTTLDEVVYERGASMDLARCYFPKICDAVSELHESFCPALIHRDLKPANIMIAGEEVVVIDFGISRTYNDCSSDDTKHFGTKAYAPPEQFGYAQTDERSDIYALGMLLYYMLTYKTPSPGLVNTQFAGEGLSEGVVKLLFKACAFDPRERFQSVSEFKDAFLSLAPAPELAATSDESELGNGGILHQIRALVVPTWLCVAWDMVLVAYCVLMATVCIHLVVTYQNDENLAYMSQFGQALLYSAVWLMLCSPVLLLMVRRPLLAVLPFLSRFSIGKRIGILLAVEVAAMIVILMLAIAFPRS